MVEKVASAGVQHFESQLQEKAAQLVDVLAAGRLNEAMEIIRQLHEFRHQAFYSEVGHLTRGLHEAIKSFSSEVSSFQTDDGKENHLDASGRLGYVIELTEKSSHETMDRIDSALTLVDRLDQQSARFKELLSLVGQLEDDYEALNGVYDRTCQLKSESETTIEALRNQLTDIVVSQSYQDLTGQLIRRVITLITNVEQHLVQLMEMASKVEQMAGIDEGIRTVSHSKEKSNEDQHKDPLKAEGPQVKGKEQAGAACDQDDVDELLSSLGF